MKKHLFTLLGSAIGLAFGSIPIQAQDVPDAAQDCVACHAVEEPAGTLESRMTRQGPPLHYAGNKFRREWLVEWLQQPTRIRPAGDFPPAHVVTEGEEDVIDAASLVDHPALPADSAETVTDWLMTLTAKSDLVEAEADYEPGNINLRLGEMDFVKFKGCGACHKDVPDYGGFSGPELYTGWARLQPEYMISYIRDPQAWEPYSLMPNKGLRTEQIHKLVDYLHVISEEE